MLHIAHDQPACLWYSADAEPPIVISAVCVFNHSMHQWSTIFALHNYCRSHRKRKWVLWVSLPFRYLSWCGLGTHGVHYQHYYWLVPCSFDGSLHKLYVCIHLSIALVVICWVMACYMFSCLQKCLNQSDMKFVLISLEVQNLLTQSYLLWSGHKLIDHQFSLQ